MSKIQILKAIHNNNTMDTILKGAVYDVKDTNFESNSQQKERIYILYLSCLWCQRYKFWKQFTTYGLSEEIREKLFMMSKIQILKAIHNLR